MMRWIVLLAVMLIPTAPLYADDPAHEPHACDRYLTPGEPIKGLPSQHHTHARFHRQQHEYREAVIERCKALALMPKTFRDRELNEGFVRQAISDEAEANQPPAPPAPKDEFTERVEALLAKHHLTAMDNAVRTPLLVANPTSDALHGRLLFVQVTASAKPPIVHLWLPFTDLQGTPLIYHTARPLHMGDTRQCMVRVEGGLPITQDSFVRIVPAVKEVDCLGDHPDFVRPPTTRTATPPKAPPKTVPKAPATTKQDYNWFGRDLFTVLEDDHSGSPPSGHGGKVIMALTIDQTGHVLNVAVKKSSGYQDLDDHATHRLNSLSIIPLTQDLDRPQITVNLPFLYKLRGD